MVCLILSFSGNIFAADVILSEYNAVDETEFLNGGVASADLDGGRASDSYFGRVQGNGGDWFELVVITDHLDMRKWQLRIRNSGGTIIFGPAGEGISPASGVSDIEIFRLEANPSASITPASADYDDGKELSTFGSPNRWGLQDFSQLRSVAIEPSTLTLLSPNGSEIIMGGTTYDITWGNTGTVDSVLIECSIDNGDTWARVYPANIGNTGSYNWLVPIVDPKQCIVRVRNTGDLSVYDTSNAVFTIYECVLDGDLTGDCVIDMADFSVMATSWLECGYPE